ncbi:hypothetical protein GPM19_00200 [Halomonas sp. ZH2S]|uniref:Uncharacterized protein n=1 Tax=Vreelandella zhuhanensis TaxID=2684210 RepID=A0A7X3KNR8_9GAMM|nr:hypothetical protein [Halomonas zhuhanensis]
MAGTPSVESGQFASLPHLHDHVARHPSTFSAARALLLSARSVMPAAGVP